eukprot:14497-Heterococcus_DN1.PRE.1
MRLQECHPAGVCASTAETFAASVRYLPAPSEARHASCAQRMQSAHRSHRTLQSLDRLGRTYRFKNSIVNSGISSDASLS